MGTRYKFASYTRPLSVEKTKWELYLKELGLEDDTAIHALRHGTGAAAEIQAWVRSNCTRTFIPEMVLEVLGVEMVFADVLKRKEDEIW
jgi:hypothetical protein